MKGNNDQLRSENFWRVYNAFYIIINVSQDKGVLNPFVNKTILIWNNSL